MASCATCSKPAVFETERVGKYGTKNFCGGCFAKKAAKYELRAVPLHGTKTAVKNT